MQSDDNKGQNRIGLERRKDGWSARGMHFGHFAKKIAHQISIIIAFCPDTHCFHTGHTEYVEVLNQQQIQLNI